MCDPKEKRTMEKRPLKDAVRLVFLIGCSLSALLFSCSPKNEYEDAFDYSHPVDLSDILQAYDYYEKHGEEENDSIVSSILRGNAPETVTYESPDGPPQIMVYLSEDTSFVLRAPEYAASPHPFLAYAEDLYNGFVWIWNVWSNIEFWHRGKTTVTDYDGEDVKDAIRKLDTGIFNDEEIRLAAKTCQDSMLALMDLPIEDWNEDIPIDKYLETYMNLLEEKMNSFITDSDFFYEKHNDLIESLGGKSVRESYIRYEKADAEIKLKAILDELKSSRIFNDMITRYEKARSEKQLKVILGELNSSRTFDDQITLWGLWANNKKSIGEDAWIVAVGERLLESGLYCPVLDNIWLTWRALCQYMYFGMSRDSCIPNQYYNQMRKICFCACLKRIQSHPDDFFAINCAYNLVRTCNLNRYGENNFGNNALTEMAMTLPDRFDKE